MTDPTESPQTMTDAALLSAVGAALFGPHWRNQLAREIRVNERSVRRWLEDDHVPAGVWADVAELASHRHAELGPLIVAAKARAVNET